MEDDVREPEESVISRVQAHDVEGFYYGEGDRGRSSKVIHHFLPFVDSLAYRSFLETQRWSRQAEFFRAPCFILADDFSKAISKVI